MREGDLLEWMQEVDSHLDREDDRERGELAWNSGKPGREVDVCGSDRWDRRC